MYFNPVLHVTDFNYHCPIPMTPLSYFQIKVPRQYAKCGMPLEKININVFHDNNVEKSSVTWCYQERFHLIFSSTVLYAVSYYPF